MPKPRPSLNAAAYVLHHQAAEGFADFEDAEGFGDLDDHDDDDDDDVGDGDEEGEEGAEGEEEEEEKVEEEELSEEELARRYDEMVLVRRADTAKLEDYEDCWVLLPTGWLNEWTAYVAGEGPRPGVVRNHELLEVDNTPRPGLIKVRDYRAVNCKVYGLYAELYGTDCTPAVCRYQVDLYSPPVLGKFKEDALRGPLLDARVAAQEIRAKYEYPPSEPDDDDDELICCWCITRTCVENCIYAMLTCGKQLVAPPRYQKLKNMDEGDDFQGLDDDYQEKELYLEPASDGAEETKEAPSEWSELEMTGRAKQGRRGRMAKAGPRGGPKGPAKGQKMRRELGKGQEDTSWVSKPPERRRR